MKRRILAMIMAVFTLVTSVGVINVVTVAAESSVLLSDNFESGAISSSWLKTGGLSLYNYGGEYGNVMQYEGGAAWHRVGYNFDSVISAGKIKVSFDINPYVYPVEGGDANKSTMVYLTSETLAASGVDTTDPSKKVPLMRVTYTEGGLYISPVKVVDDAGTGVTDAWYVTSDKSTLEFSHKTTENEWTRVDMLVDITGGKIDYYFNGKHYCTNNREGLSTVLSSVYAIMLRGLYASDCTVLFDNFNVKTIDEEVFDTESVNVDESAKTIELKFNSTISADSVLTPENVTINQMGGGSAISVTSVEKPLPDKLRIKYTGELSPGREYKLAFTNGLKSVLDASLNDIMFNASSFVMLDEKIENFDDKDIDAPFNKTNSKTADGEWAVEEIYESTGDNTYKLKFARVEGTGHSATSNMHNLTLGVNLTNATTYPAFSSTKGKTTIQFDYNGSNPNNDIVVKYNNNNTSVNTTMCAFGAAGYVYANYNNDSNVAVGSFALNNDHKVKIEIDYDNNAVTYNFDTLSKTITFEEMSYDKTTGAMNNFTIHSWAKDTTAMTIDNFKVSHSEDIVTVSKVRFVDANDTEVAGDTLAEGTKAVKLTFNSDMTEESLNGNVTLVNTNGTVEFTGSLGEDKRTYTLTPTGTDAFAGNPEYTLNIAEEAGVYEAVTYKFAVGTTTVSSVTKADTASVALGTAIKDANLPATVVGTDENGGTVNIPVVWSADGYWKHTPGTYTLTGSLTAPMGYELAEGLTGSIDVTVAEDTAAVQLVEGATVRMSESAQTPLNTGAFLQTDTLQMGLEAGTITVTSDEFETLSGIADATGGEKGGASAITSGDGEIEIAFTEKYDGGKALSDIRLVFEDLKDDAGAAGWNLELLYKNSSGEWIKFYKGEKLYSERSFNTYPALIIRGLSEKLTDVNGLKIRLLGRSYGYKLLEADINMADDGSVTEAVRDTYTTPIRFANMLSNNAVIQRDKPITIWGYGGMSGDEITVSIKNGENVVKSATATSDGEKWEATLEAMEGSLTEYTITAECGDNKAEITGVMFGDVFIASGQSNMAYALGNVYNRLDKLNTEEATAYLNKTVAMAEEDLPGLRFYNQGGGEKLSALEPFEDDYLGQWFTNGSYHGGVYNASAVGYFFAYDLYKKLGETIPVAFIEAARGGTSVKAWMNEETYTSAVADDLTDDKIVSHNSGLVNTGCWNAMVAPFTKHAFKGVIWYQGEGDHAQYANYDKWFEAMLQSWHKEFNDDTLTFTTVQIADWDGGASSGYYPEFRQTQLQVWQRNEGMVNMISAVDLGENDNDSAISDDIHPLYKTPVGTRLSAAVLANVYNKDVEYSGPLFDKAVKTTDGIEISFTHADGLKAQTRTGQYKEEYTVNDSVNNIETSADGIEWMPATAVVADGKVKVTCDSSHKYVRYAWKDWNGGHNLYNGSNYPAYPFMASTDMSNVSISETDSGIKVSVPVSDRLKISGKLIAAKYNKTSDTLVDVEIKDASFVLNDTDIEYNFDMQLGDNEYIKVMMISSLDGLSPLAKFGIAEK